MLWLKIAIPIALACGYILSWRLWLSSRIFPLSPLTDFLPTIPYPLDLIWLFVLLCLLASIILVARSQKLIFIFLLLAGLQSLGDQTRWQPWFYQYFLMLAVIGFYAWKKPEKRYQAAALNICRLIVVFTYVWSGLQKLNVNFIRETWPDIAGPFLRWVPEAARNIPAPLILMIPVLEILTGLGLITRKFRNAAVLLASATHIFVLALLISSGENRVVWPWNVVMVLFVVLLFWQDQETTAGNILRPRSGLHATALLLCAVLPALSLVDLWDSYLSAALYSGNTHQAVILVSPAVIERLPPAVRPHVWQESKPFFLDINRWAYGELNTPVYPEPRVYRAVARRICAYADNSPDIKLLIRGKPNPFNGQRQSAYYDCDHLASDER
ncbi:MAG: hypothetical protein M3O35_07405 [Acidobacteriota bacterium]|nr:hypothetical protein [Acidobacteriota bacterium]